MTVPHARVRRPVFAALLLTALYVLITCACAPDTRESGGWEQPRATHATKQCYYSQGPLEPDKMASAWLLQRHVAPACQILLLPDSISPPPDAIPFDMPTGQWSRQATRTTYEMIIASEHLRDTTLIRIGRYLRAGEFGYWMLDPGSPAGLFDLAMKRFSQLDALREAFAFLDSLHVAGGEMDPRLIPSSCPPPSRPGSEYSLRRKDRR